ncbi:biotin--[acetyl-CoA-carboxylase] ligase [Marinilabiliaceae bacterium JC040]|nr:biotin--[acetyl-CoA-carboxylase] ligase [Marinilabiliaceae bacterium JC040]
MITQSGKYNIISKEELASTNEYMSLLLHSKEVDDHSVIVCNKQTSGKGQKGNFWEAEEGKNLTFSLLYKPFELLAMDQFTISIIISLGICDYLKEKAIDNVKIKWPNDIYVGDNKVCGILIEHEISGEYLNSSICGVGLNINQEEFKSSAPNPVSLINITNQKYSLEKELLILLDCIEKRYITIEDNRDLLWNDYKNYLYRFNKVYKYKTEDGIIEGKIVGVNKYGQLLLKSKDLKINEYSFKEISFII